MSELNKLIEIVKQVFPSKEGFNVIIKDTNIFIIETEETRCLVFTFENSKIYIGLLHKCSIHGTESLRRIEEVAKRLSDKTSIMIELADASSIEYCSNIFINLAILKIITKGESWYNSLGYVSDNYEIEKSHNSVIRELSCIRFIEELYRIKINTLMERYSKSKIIENIKRLESDQSRYAINKKNDYIYILNNYEEFIESKINIIKDSIKYFRDGISYFEDPNNSINIELNKLWQKLIENKICDRPIFEWLSKFLEYIFDSKIIKYDYNLTKRIQHGGRKLRKQRKSKKQRKSRKNPEKK